ncbi:hypothetical protein [Megamonas hypermegale]|uniref:hypothetical protein n=1 Tax=Megamonas hypermegale TaxID=158847 RepID=UPI0026EB5CBC|nr:hypothetical protein [Megamonas hypermegale]
METVTRDNRNKEGDLLAYDIALNVNTNDLVLQNGDLIIIDNAERVAQQILITLRFWLNEWFLDTRQGVPYLEYILVKNPNMSHIRQILTQQIQSVEGVKDIVSLDLDFRRVTRELYVYFEADTDYGLVTERAVLGYGG